jgi:hypothetical protein
MSDLPEEPAAERLLREGLAEMPFREPSAEFDARIQAALRPRPSLREALWSALRPGLAAAACSAFGMLALLRWNAAFPVTLASDRLAPASHNPMAIFRSMNRVDDLDLTRINLSLLPTPKTSPASTVPPTPRRRADRVPPQKGISPHAQSLIRPYA